MRIHFIGCAGVSMRWLAQYFRAIGEQVSGSDIALGGHLASNVDEADLVVYTSAISPDNEELVRAQELGIPIVPRAKLLGEVSRNYESVIAVAGSHGKTTVTGMIACILKNAAVHVGASSISTDNRTAGEMLVSEACEYKESFLELKRDIAVVLNADLDHTDYYADESAIMDAYGRFVSLAETLVTTTALAHKLVPKNRIVTVGEGGDSYVVSFSPGRHIMLSLWGRQISFATTLIGKHNAENFAFAAATAALAGASDDDIALGLSEFRGMSRRLEYALAVKNIPVYNDYAHHPREISVTIDALKGAGSRKILVAFQPHTYSRLNSFMPDFVRSLKKCDSIILPVFAAREKYSGGYNSDTLAKALLGAGARSLAVSSFDEAVTVIRNNAQKYDCIVVMGAGDTPKLIDLLKQ